jgi:hypothetical protein
MENDDELTTPLLPKKTEFKAADCNYKCLQIIVSNNESVALNDVLKDPAINKSTPIDYVGLLRTAMYKEAIECMDILLDVSGIDVNFTDSHYKFPILWLAASLGKANAVKTLLKSTTINIHKGPPLGTLTEVDNKSVVVDVGGQSPLNVATIELNTLRNKPNGMFDGESVIQIKKEKIKKYDEIIEFLTKAGAKYNSSDSPTTMKRKVKEGGKSRRRKKKRQSKKTKKGRPRKYKK